MDGRGPGMDSSRRGNMDNRNGKNFPPYNNGAKRKISLIRLRFPGL